MIYNVQVLRALAAYLVVFVHLEPVLRPAGISGPPLTFGGAGVDLFFVISGFVMVYTTGRRDVTPGGFLGNRIIRIVPLYWLMTLGVFGVALTIPSLLGTTRASLPELAKSLAFIPFVKSNGLIQPVLFLGWTLNYEMFFYLVFTVAMYAATTERRVIYAGAALIAAVIATALLKPTAVPLEFLGRSIILEFLMGMVAGLVQLRGFAISKRIAWPMLVLCLAFLILHPFFMAHSPRFVSSGLPSMAILIAAISLEEQGVAYRGGAVQLLGAASYALYLSHPFVTQAVGTVAHRAGFVTLGPLLAASLVALVAVGLVAVAIHLLVERPIGRLLRGAAGRRPSVVERAEARIV